MTFLELVPKDLASNLAYRVELRARAEKEPDYRKAVTEACKHDSRYFCNSLAWIYEPRPRIVDGKKLPHVIPFITWPHQDKAIRIITEHLGFKDIGVDKSRGEGASWIAVTLALHDW